ncbi:ABC transporter-related protein [Dictyostelium discoideum AX4]|uniref:ABC transporter F family member 2 n=1 Tax=Dictyostelium discoideum TaxID=44689 RepID=ABCF2_DICDI|nr:ABC transporter-related protein [Dictyostelium discoideum AX4]Q8T6B7.1 RecName: Full=ABC transporter F family member 2 [Dictyostelium discoideum]AAL87692.1 non-transporter ABC protein AbcF2 [Dictyostelium discoideum]EAL65364.1 ABC transporter-related protein [Dictyostelium discoideum AX4]|eukprot:XP_638739.1 ABC transporter-related protein [Dictyostelium discoideum AX4]
MAKKGGKNNKSKKEVTPPTSDVEDEVQDKFKEMRLNAFTATGALASKESSRDVKIEQVTLTFHGKELLSDTTVEINFGRRYGLIGQNGCGKSTFFQCLAVRELPIPEHIDIFHLSEEAHPSERTALQSVIDDAEKEVKRLEVLEERLLEEQGPESEELFDVYERLENLDPTTFVPRASEILIGLGFTSQTMLKKTKDLSGGWRMRVSLAKALFIKPTLLLLDEPTNHLDLGACVWLEDYLANYDRSLIIISHSQDFLNAVCTNIIHMTQSKLKYYGGNYDNFVKTKAELEVNQMKAYHKQQEEIAHIKSFIASCGTYSNLVRQGKSKQKIIDKMEEAGLVERVQEDKIFNFSFPPCGELAPPIMHFDNVTFSYSGKEADVLYRNLDLAIDLDSRIALVGPNGAGKSTLLKLMVGQISPTQGFIKKHSHLKMARYHQHAHEVLDLTATPLDFVRSKFAHMNKDTEEWRREIGRFGVTGKAQTEAIGCMSDGIKSRLIFCLMALENPHLLLLDEPTNHLDMECIDSLALAINSFPGGMILVSHDFRLISQVAKEIWVCDNKTITKWAGDITSYKNHLKAQMRDLTKQGALASLKK